VDLDDARRKQSGASLGADRLTATILDALTCATLGLLVATADALDRFAFSVTQSEVQRQRERINIRAILENSPGKLMRDGCDETPPTGASKDEAVSVALR
jgi:hypothetical protein